MNSFKPNLPALLGARICHDLISPVGAISNGMELLSMVGNTNGPEAELIGKSVDNANARLRLYRMAFGNASADTPISSQAFQDLLHDYYGDSGFSVDYVGFEDIPRPKAKLLLLLILCCETSMARRGEIHVTGLDRLSCKGTRLPDTNDHWARLVSDADWPDDLVAADVHFPLAQEALQQSGLRLCTNKTEDGIDIWTEAALSDVLINREPSRPLRQGT